MSFLTKLFNQKFHDLSQKTYNSVKNVAPLKTVKIKDKISVRLKRLIKAMNKIPKLYAKRVRIKTLSL